MNEKVKVLFINEKKIKSNRSRKTLGDIIELQVPNTYSINYEHFGKNILEKIAELEPQIVFLTQKESKDTLGLLKKIKQTYPSMVVFVFISEIDDEEQKIIDKYLAAGAYKCLFLTMSVDSLIHDMHVALNLE